MMENKKYSLLLVALYCYSGHIKAVIDHLKSKNPLIDLTLLTNKPEEMKEMLADKSVKIEWYNVSPVKYKQRWLRFLVIKHQQRKFFAKFSRGRKYDIVNVHFPNKYMSFVCRSLQTMSDNLIITPWGSDVLRMDDKALIQLGKLYRRAKYIATAQESPLGERIINDFKVDPEKLKGNFFGSDTIDYLIKNGDSITQEEAKQRFGLRGRYVVTCGYNAIRHQRHKDIIAAIGAVKDQLPDNLTLLFPMAYNDNNGGDYIGECQQHCKERGLDAVFLTEFMSIEDVSKLRKCTDIFVHIQTTDAGSSTIKEYALCNTKIVHGTWVKYEEMEKFKPLFYFPVEKMEDLGEMIVKAYKSDNIDIPQGVIDYVKKGGWDNKATLMNDFFMSIVNR